MILALLFAASPIDVAISSTLAGQFAARRCDGSEEAPFVRLSRQFEGAGEALRFDAGDLFGTASIGAFAVEHDVDGLAEAIAALKLSGLALGHRDLAAPRAQLMALARALEARGLRYTLSNLKCDEGAREECTLIGDVSVIGKIGFISAVSPTALTHIAKDRTNGLSLDAPALALSAATKKARALGAEWVIATYDPELGREVEDTIQMALALDVQGSPDVVFVAGIADKLRHAVSALAETEIIALRWAEVTHAQLTPNDEPVLEKPTLGEPIADVRTFAEALNREMCAKFDTQLSGGALDQPLERDDVARLVLDVMREEARAEVAVMNRLAFSARAPYPFSGSLTPLGLMQTLPFENGVRLARMTGNQFRAFLDGPTAGHFYVRGAVKDKDVWRINGRLLDGTASYRVVTTDFVAEGGHGGLGANLSFNRPTPKTVRETVQAWLDKPGVGPILKRPIDPSERTRWTLFYRLQVDLSNVAVVNPDPLTFTETQLARGQSLSVAGEAEFRAIGDHPGYALENQSRLRFGVVSTVSTTGMASGVVNNVDIISGRTLYFYRRLFSPEPKWYHPRLYGDMYVESELTRPATRPYHHLQLVPTAGLRFELAPPFALYFGGGMAWEALATRDQLVPPQDPAAAIFVAGWQLRPTKIVQLGDRAIEGETNLDFYSRDWASGGQGQLRFRVRFSVPIYSVFTLAVTYDAFLRYFRNNVGFAGDLIVGLSVNYSHALQAFRF